MTLYLHILITVEGATPPSTVIVVCRTRSTDQVAMAMAMAMAKKLFINILIFNKIFFKSSFFLKLFTHVFRDYSVFGYVTQH